MQNGYLYGKPMTRSITIADWIHQADAPLLIDVRTPAEFAQGHVPGAVNIPIFSNEERVQVGTTYKRVGRQPASLLGFDLVGPKWSGFIRQCEALAPDKRIAVHCWRGGMRSGAMAWALGMYGFEVYQVRGGYKAFRAWCRQQFGRPYNLQVLGGMTGSGKTRLLRYMAQQGDPVIDLEALARHQGSAYGSMNRMIQPSQEQFENNLAWQLKDKDTEQQLWIEDESQKIGRCIIPLPLWTQMRAAALVDLQVPRTQRVAALAAEYGVLDPGFLAERTLQIHKRLGPEQTKHAVAAIQEGRIEDFISLVLVYYDKTYQRGLNSRNKDAVYPLPVSGSTLEADRATLHNFTATLPEQTVIIDASEKQNQ